MTIRPSFYHHIFHAFPSDGKDVENIDKLTVYRLVDPDGLIERNIDYLVVLHTDHHVALTVLEGFDGSDSQAAREDAVVGGRYSAALEMAENGDAGLELRVLVYETVCIILGSACAVLLALGHEDDGAVLALAHSPADEGSQLIDIRLVLRNDGCFGSGCNCRILSKESGIATHHFHEEDAVVGVGGVTYLVNTFHDSIESRVISDGGIRSVEVVVYGTRKSYTRYVILGCYDLGSGKRTVTSYHDEGIYVVCPEILVSLGPAFLVHEALAACRSENGTASVDGTADTLGCKILDFIIDKAFPASVYSLDLPSVEDGCSCNGPDGRIHSRRITSRGEDAYCLYL